MSILAVDARPRLRGAAYLRKSPGTSQDKTEISLERQLEEIRARMDADGVDCVAVFTDVHPRWELWERPDLTALRELVKARGLDYVYTWDTSRLATGVKHQSILLDEGERFGVAYRFVNEAIDHSSPLGQLMWSITSTFNEIELERIRDRTNGGKQKRLGAGKLLSHAKANYGYRFADDTRSALIVYAPEARVVRDVYAWVCAGLTTGQVAARLTEQGVLPPGKAAVWHTSTLLEWLHNPAYKGEPVVYRHRTYRKDGRTVRVARDPSEWRTLPPGTVPPIVDAATWQRAQEALTRHRTQAVRSMRPDRTTEFLLRGGLAVCAHCGSPLHALTVPRGGAGARKRVVYRTYTCASVQRARVDRLRDGPDAAPRCETPPRLRAEPLDLAVWHRVLETAEASLRPQDAAGEKARAAAGQRALRDAERRVARLERLIERTALELVQAETEPERVALRGLQKTHAAQLGAARTERDEAASAVVRSRAREEAGLRLFRAVTENKEALWGLVPGRVSPAEYATMRGMLDLYRVRVVVWHKDDPDAPAGGWAVEPWDGRLEGDVWRTVSSASTCPASSTPHIPPPDPERLAPLLARLSGAGGAWAGAAPAAPGG